MILTILGCHSATPKTFHNPTSQLLEVKGHLFLIDCGEGTQVALRKSKVKFARIKHIFISHLHGDHFYGLIGLISTFTLLGREADLNIYGPKGIKEIITLQLKLSKSWTNYSLLFHELDSKISEKLFEDEKVEVFTIPLDHRVYTNGYLFKEKTGERKLNPKAAIEANIDKSYFRKLKMGEDVVNEKGQLIPNQQVTFPPEPPKSYAFCSDTAFKPEISPQIEGVTALYHEATFLEEHLHLCEKTKHSTAKQAATIARDAGVEQLILGHFSTRYDDLNLFLEEAKEVFEETSLAADYKVFEI
ncbi:ribonuclease Z [Planktosalinus lacus]|uniref:Ribonuclease Z n=1 Tax=Planktosalinus lacus TaxID=1526573 RepID=A0A8J2VAP9_9FLAO|nr:ribonuclease Z [Planktosalinus lacus]GGD98069.1 ribonuclease Z [Planktosalinus lacus]